MALFFYHYQKGGKQNDVIKFITKWQTGTHLKHEKYYFPSVG